MRSTRVLPSSWFSFQITDHLPPDAGEIRCRNHQTTYICRTACSALSSQRYNLSIYSTRGKTKRKLARSIAQQKPTSMTLRPTYHRQLALDVGISKEEHTLQNELFAVGQSNLTQLLAHHAGLAQLRWRLRMPLLIACSAFLHCPCT